MDDATFLALVAIACARGLSGSAAVELVDGLEVPSEPRAAAVAVDEAATAAAWGDSIPTA